MRNKKEILEWANQRGLLNVENSSRQMLKVMEELGETAGALAKGNREALIDGIGDTLVTLIILSAQMGLDIEECLDAAYDEIKDRTGNTIEGVFIKD